MLSHRQRKARTLLGVSDILVTALAFEAALLVRHAIPIAQLVFAPGQKALVLGFCILVLVSTGYLFNVYGRIDSARLPIIVRDSLRQTAWCAASLITLVFALKVAISRIFLVVFTGALGFLLIGFRVALRNLLPAVRRHFGIPRHILITGTGPRARRFAQSLELWRDHGLHIIGFLACPDDESRPVTLRLAEEYPVFPFDDLPSILRREVLDEICFAIEPDQFSDVEEAWLSCREQGVCSRIAVDFFAQDNCQVSVERFGGTSLLTFSAAPDDEILLLIKRLIDIVLAGTALAVLSPLLLSISILIKLTSRGPVIFRQTRCGLNGRTFTLYKFRSMIADAEERIGEVAHLNTRKIVTKIPNDPRMTPLGRWLRKFSLDEFPQLVNILRGDMSLVGPRPAIPSEVARYKRWQRRRLRMRPGLTCLWALNGRDNVDFESWMQLDMSYIDNWSLALDTMIILKTIPQVISGKGAS